nr:zinc finger, CCHC-type, retrotransposon Gag domain protein [Tanacetum cinerariifolium]
MRRVGKGFSGVETPLFEGMLAARTITEEGITEEQVQADDVVAAAVQETVAEDIANEAIPSTPTPLILPSPPSHDIPSLSQVQSSPLQQPQSSPQAPPQSAKFPTHLFQQTLEIIKLKARVKRLERANKVKSSKLRSLKKVGTSQRIESSDDMEDVFNHGRMIDDLDNDEGIELVVDQVKDANTGETEGRHAAEQAEKQAEIYHLDLDHSSKVLKVVTAATSQVSAASATISAAMPSIPAAASTDKGKGILIETSKPMKKKDQIELDAEYVRKLHEEINKDIDWDAAIDHTESEARKNMMIYLKNTACYKLDFFKGMSYDEICPIFQARFDANMRFLFKSREEIEEEDQEVLKSINETPAQKAAKRKKLNEEAQEVKDLKKHLEERLKREYHSIRQTNTETSTEFMQRFLRLAVFLEAAAGTEEEQAKNFQWGLRRSTLNHLMCMSYTDVAQVANASHNYEILHERDDDDAERPDKRQKSGDRHQPTSQQSSHRNHGHNNDRHGSDRRGGSDNHRSSNNNYSGSNNRNSDYGRDQRNRVCTTCGRRHPGECCRAAGTCFKCGQAGHLQKDCKKNTTASTSGQADKKPGASGRVFAMKVMLLIPQTEVKLFKNIAAADMK